MNSRSRPPAAPPMPAALPEYRPPRAPAHLSKEVTKWWKSVVSEYDLEPHQLRLLQSAAEAWDRMQQARRALDEHGSLTFTGANGEPKTRPEVAIERDARVAYARLVRELDLDAEPTPERGRPPALRSNRR